MFIGMNFEVGPYFHNNYAANLGKGALEAGLFT